MGSCANTGEIENNVHSNKRLEERIDGNENNNQNKNHSSKHANNLQRLKETISTDPFLEPKYKNFPEEEDQYSGEGVKFMKAYKTKMKIDELTALRDAFFTERYKKQGPIWKHIRYACIYDATKSEHLLKAMKLTPVDGVMNKLIDAEGNTYVIPNFCINDPLVQKELTSIDEKRKSEMLTLKLYNAYTNEKVSLEVEDNMTVSELKQMFCIGINREIELSKIRLFFGGVELKNDNYLYQHEIRSNFAINVMIRE